MKAATSQKLSFLNFWIYDYMRLYIGLNLTVD